MSNYRGSKVFISYNRKDKLMVKPIAEALEEKGISIWIDWRKESLGKIWVKKLENAIKKANDVVVLFGKHGLGDVQTDEYHAAYGSKKNIIPVLLPGANEEKLDTFLKNRDWLDLRDGIDEEKIVKLVQGLISDKSEQSDSDKYRNTPKRVYHKFSTPLEFCYTQNSRFGEQLQISRHAKESIARYCSRVDSDFKWGESVFIQAGSLSAFILFHMYRTNSQNQPKIIITNLLACSAISMTAKAQADSLGESTCGIDSVQTHLIEGNLIGNFASTMPEDLMGLEGKFCDDENRKCSSLVDCLVLKQPDHVVMMATYFKANKGPYSNDLHSCRLKKLLMRYVHKNSKRKAIQYL
jgi:hypothetical protein